MPIVVLYELTVVVPSFSLSTTIYFPIRLVTVRPGLLSTNLLCQRPLECVKDCNSATVEVMSPTPSPLLAAENKTFTSSQRPKLSDQPTFYSP